MTGDTDLLVLEPEPEEIDETFGVSIIWAFEEVDASTLKNASPKRYIAAASGGGFEVRAGVSATLEKRPPFKSGEHAGEPRPDVQVAHLWVQGKAPGAAFQLHFQDNGFAGAIVWDVAGWPIELYADYTPKSYLVRRQKDEPERAFKGRVAREERIGEKNDSDYNDGEFWVNTSPRSLLSAGAFEEWLTDLVPGFEPRKKAVPKAKKTEEIEAATAVALLAGGDWIG